MAAAQVGKDERMFLAAIKTGDGTFWELGECPRAIPKKSLIELKGNDDGGSEVKLRIIIPSTLLKAAKIAR